MVVPTPVRVRYLSDSQHPWRVEFCLWAWDAGSVVVTVGTCGSGSGQPSGRSAGSRQRSPSLGGRSGQSSYGWVAVWAKTFVSRSLTSDIYGISAVGRREASAVGRQDAAAAATMAKVATTAAKAVAEAANAAATAAGKLAGQGNQIWLRAPASAMDALVASMAGRTAEWFYP